MALVKEGPAAPPGPEPGSGATPGRRRLARRPPGMVAGLIILGLMVLAGLIGPVLVPYDPIGVDPAVQLQAPSAAHPFGTDEYGRDILARVLHATRLDLAIAVGITALAATVGTLIGAVAGFYGRGAELAIMRLVDVLQSFPAFILGMGVLAMLGNTVGNVIIAVAVAYTPYYIRLTRGEMLSLRDSELADSARCAGNPSWRIMLVHLLPGCLAPVMVQASLTLGWGILDAAGLSFLGLGIKPPKAEWGVMVSEGTQNIFSGQWWTSFFPGLAIMVAVLAFNLIADGLQDLKDRPRGE